MKKFIALFCFTFISCANENTYHFRCEIPRQHTVLLDCVGVFWTDKRGLFAECRGKQSVSVGDFGVCYRIFDEDEDKE